MEQPFTEDYLLYLLAQASEAASGEFHAYLSSQNIPVTTWRILGSLYPSRQLNVGSLARECLLKQPTLTRIIDRLETQKLVKRAHSKESRREVYITLTKEGRALAKRFILKAKQHETDILADYSADEVIALKKALKVLRERTKID